VFILGPSSSIITDLSQPFAKYLTRLSLYLSTSIPALEFSIDNIYFIEDQCEALASLLWLVSQRALDADGWFKAQNPPSETIMTDGCGFLNRAAALKISAKLKYAERIPVAYQGAPRA
jgi:RNA-dependent RNA polymerase